MNLYPIMLRLGQKRAVVVGGGPVAVRKVRDLLECGAIVTVIAPEIHGSMNNLLALFPDRITINKRCYNHGDCEGAFIVFSATDDHETNRQVSQEALEKNIIMNAVDDPENCSFIVPSWFDKNGVIIAVSTSGKSPAFAARLRREIEKTLPESIENMLAALEETRRLLKIDPEFKDMTPQQRGHLLTQIVNNNDLLAELNTYFTTNTLKAFLRNIRSNDSEPLK